MNFEKINKNPEEKQEKNGYLKRFSNFIKKKESDINTKERELPKEKKSILDKFKNNNKLLTLIGVSLVGTSIIFPSCGGLAGLGLGSGFIEAGSTMAILEQGLTTTIGTALAVNPGLMKNVFSNLLKKDKISNIDLNIQDKKEEKQEKDVFPKENNTSEDLQINIESKKESIIDQKQELNDEIALKEETSKTFQELKEAEDRAKYVKEKAQTLINKDNQYIVDFFKKIDLLDENKEIQDKIFSFKAAFENAKKEQLLAIIEEKKANGEDFIIEQDVLDTFNELKYSQVAIEEMDNKALELKNKGHQYSSSFFNKLDPMGQNPKPKNRIFALKVLYEDLTEKVKEHLKNDAPEE